MILPESQLRWIKFCSAFIPWLCWIVLTLTNFAFCLSLELILQLHFPLSGNVLFVLGKKRPLLYYTPILCWVHIIIISMVTYIFCNKICQKMQRESFSVKLKLSKQMHTHPLLDVFTNRWHCNTMLRSVIYLSRFTATESRYSPYDTSIQSLTSNTSNDSNSREIRFILGNRWGELPRAILQNYPHEGSCNETWNIFNPSAKTIWSPVQILRRRGNGVQLPRRGNHSITQRRWPSSCQMGQTSASTSKSKGREDSELKVSFIRKGVS